MVEKAEKTQGRKILVTGSSGMLGTALCGELSGSYDVIGMDVRQLSAIRCQPSAFVRCDITNRDKVIKSITEVEPGLIVHAAAWTDVDGCEREPAKAKDINVKGTENIAFSAKALNAFLVYISTDFVFNGRKGKLYTEEDRPGALNVYGASKLEGEKIVAGLKGYVILRTSWLFGPNGRNFVDAILNKAEKERELKVVDDQFGSPTYVKDLARAIKRLINKLYDSGAISNPEFSVGEIYHLSNKGVVSWFDYAKQIIKLSPITGVRVVPIKSSQLGLPAKRPPFSALDNSKFEKTTGFAMRGWQEALCEYLTHREARVGTGK